MILAHFAEAANSLTTSLQRTFLALIGIGIGIGSVIAMITVGNIVKTESIRRFQEMGTDVLTIRKEYIANARGAASKRKIKLREAMAMAKDVPTLREIAPYTVNFSKMMFKGKKKEIPGLGVTKSFFDINRLDMVEGRFISDLDKYMNYCVLSSEIADFLNSSGAKKLVGNELAFAGKKFTIVGVIGKETLGGMRPYQINEGILIPVSTSLRLPNSDGISNIIGKIQPGVDTATIKREVKMYFTNKLDGMQVRITTAEQLIESMQDQTQLFTILLGAIGSISLIVGGVGVMNIMLMSVTERKKEIGIRRALGAAQVDIQMQFIVESFVLCLLGGAFGVLVGVGAAYGISIYSEWEFIFSYSAVFIGVCASAAVGGFFGFYPARQAAMLNPIEALQG